MKPRKWIPRATCSGPGWATPISSSAPKQTDAAEKAKRYADAVTDYQKAIDLKKKAMEAGAQAR